MAPSAEQIDSPQHIGVLLNQMLGAGNLVAITTGANSPVAVSALMGVDGKNREILLDSPYVTNSSAVKLALSNNDTADISGINDGSSLFFQAPFKEIVEERGLRLYRFAFPTKLFYSAQRESHRVNVRDFDINIAFSTSSAHLFDAPLCDISDGGLRILVEKSVIKGLSRADDIFCKIDIDEGSCNEIKVKLCHPAKTDIPNIIDLGAVFTELSAHQKGQISHYIAGIERKLLRKQRLVTEPVISKLGTL